MDLEDYIEAAKITYGLERQGFSVGRYWIAERCHYTLERYIDADEDGLPATILITEVRGNILECMELLAEAAERWIGA